MPPCPGLAEWLFPRWHPHDQAFGASFNDAEAACLLVLASSHLVSVAVMAASFMVPDKKSDGDPPANAWHRLRCSAAAHVSASTAGQLNACLPIVRGDASISTYLANCALLSIHHPIPRLRR